MGWDIETDLLWGGSADTPVSVATAGDQLFGTTYAPADGTDGGTIIVGDWQEATQFNPFYLGQVTEANVASAAWASLVVLTNDYKYAPDLAKDRFYVDNFVDLMGRSLPTS